MDATPSKYNKSESKLHITKNKNKEIIILHQSIRSNAFSNLNFELNPDHKYILRVIPTIYNYDNP